MSRYRTCKTLSIEQQAYIAGLIDGEGTVTLSRKHKNDMRQLAISVSSTEKQLLDYILNASGVGKITGKKTYRAHHLPSFTYTAYNRQALALLEQVSPYLLSYKAKRAQLVLEEYLELTPRNGKYDESALLAKTEFEKQFFELKADMRATTDEIN